jgi:hypothetical protein
LKFPPFFLSYAVAGRAQRGRKNTNGCLRWAAILLQLVLIDGMKTEGFNNPLHGSQKILKIVLRRRW